MAGHRVVAEPRAVRGEPLDVEPEVDLLVGEDRDEPAAKRKRRVGEREQRPREQLDRLQLVVRERVEDPRALRRIAHAGERWHPRRRARHDRELRWPARRGDAQRRLAIDELEPSGGGTSLAASVSPSTMPSA